MLKNIVQFTRHYEVITNKHPMRKSAATRETLRNYVLFLANTGVRHGTEALGLRWRNIEWYERDGERYLAVNVDGKTNKRTAIARDSVENSLWRQAQLNPRIRVDDFDGLIAAKLMSQYSPHGLVRL